jgi:hypothetical protein
VTIASDGGTLVAGNDLVSTINILIEQKLIESRAGNVLCMEDSLRERTDDITAHYELPSTSQVHNEVSIKPRHKVSP